MNDQASLFRPLAAVLPTATLYVDGACLGNPGPGGWGVLIERVGRQERLSNGEAVTTNNRMELRAAIEGLNALGEPHEVTLYSDSKYVVDGFTQWLPGWKRRHWRGSTGLVKNVDLWQALDAAAQRHRVRWRWIKGHAGHAGNEAADRLANTAARRIAAAP